MDKVKDFGYAIFVKHQFWTLSVIVILIGVGIWWTSSGQLKQEYDDNLKQVKTAQEDINRIYTKPENAIVNEHTEAGMKEMNAQRRRDVYVSWREMEKRQREEVLVWPEGLSAKFVKAIEKLLDGRPIEEVKPKADGTEHLVLFHRDEYRNKMKGLLPQLAEMINADWQPQAAGSRLPRGGSAGQFGGSFGGSFGGRGGEGSSSTGTETKTKEEESVVWWDPRDQGELQSTHFDWSDSDTPPTTMEILYSMEDYWVLKALMQVIQRTNADETGAAPSRRELAAIREIHSIHIGVAASGNAGEIFIEEPKAGSRENAEAGGESATGGETATQAGETPIEGADGTTPAGPDPAEGRYVDKAYISLKAQKLRSAAESKDPKEAYLAVAKRMPVRMKVKMDQRKLNKFLVECGNADLMLEVKQVRINPDEADLLTVSSARPRSSNGASAGFNQPSSRRTGQDAQADEGKFPWDVVVEVYGIIYIFNPPSPTRLTDALEKEDIDNFTQSIKEAATASAKPATDVKPAGDEEVATETGGEEEAADEPADDDPAAAEPAEDEGAAVDPGDDAPAEEVAPAKPPMAADK